MKNKSTDIIMQSKAFNRVALGTGAILLIALAIMQVNTEWDWSLSDFIIIGALLFGMGSMFVLAARRVRKKHRLAIGIAFTLATLYIWAELAVGIFTNLGS